MRMMLEKPKHPFAAFLLLFGSALTAGIISGYLQFSVPLSILFGGTVGFCSYYVALSMGFIR